VAEAGTSAQDYLEATRHLDEFMEDVVYTPNMRQLDCRIDCRPVPGEARREGATPMGWH